MSDPSATTNPLPQDNEFDPLEFWIRYKGKILLYGALLAGALLVFGLFKMNEERTKAASESAFAAAKTADDFRKVADDYPKTPSGADAQLMLADQLRTDGKIDDAITALRSFVAQHPDHPLIAIGWTSLASALEAKADLAEALSTYQKVTTSFPVSAAAPVSFLGQARVLAAQGKTEDARRIYETVIGQYQGTPFAMNAQRQVQLLKKDAAPSAPAPAETKSVTPEAPAATPAAVESKPAPAAATPAAASKTEAKEEKPADSAAATPAPPKKETPEAGKAPASGK